MDEHVRMPGLELPSNLVRDVEAHAAHRAARRAWLEELPGVVETLARAWSLEVGSPFQPGGAASWVAPARDRAGRALVLKVGWRHAEAEHEADGLRAWAGRGTVRLVESVVSGATSALLLEACRPGTVLAAAEPPAVQDRVVAGLLRRLWIAPPPGGPFRPLASMCASWAGAFEERCAAAGAVLDPGLARAGIELYRELPATAGRTVLLCTDLHAGNVLAAEREPWLVIDPKPYTGDPAYDVLQHMLNHPDRLRADPLAFIRRMAGLLDLDTARLRPWLFARCVIESLDRPDLREVAAALAP
jgi:streptomycin 6-kinase